MFFIYRLYDNLNKSYIGVTGNLDKRLKDHLSGNGSKPVYEAILQGNVFSYEILFNSENEQETYEKEKVFIEQYDSINSGYNITKGGFGGFKNNRQGTLNTQAVLNESLVMNIREEYASTNITQVDLAKKYNVSRENISAIVRGKSWANVGGPIGKRKVAIKTPMTEDLIEQVKQLRKIKTPYSEIADRLNISVYYAHKYGKGVS